MNVILSDANVGKKNIVFGIVLFLLLGVVIGIPLTIDFLGGSLLTSDQYQIWKVVHGYGVFLSFINYFLGLAIDRLELSKQHKEIVSWLFLVAGLIGGVVRMILVLIPSLSTFRIYASLAESALFVLGTIIFVSGQDRQKLSHSSESASQPHYSHAR